MNPKERLYYQLVTSGNLKELKSLFQKDTDGCSMMPYGQSLALHAVFKNEIDVLRFLIEKGCDLDKGDYDDGLTPLHAAALDNNNEAALVLLQGGAQPDVEDRFGSTPLFRAVYSYRDDPVVILLLLQYGADPLYKNNDGLSPRAFAERKEHAALLEVFDEQVQKGN